MAGTYDGQLQIIDSLSYVTEMSIQAHEEPIRALTYVPATIATASNTLSVNNKDTALIATSGKDKTVKLWGYQTSSHRITSTPVFTFDGHINSVECLAYYSVDHLLLSGDWSGNVFAWDLKSDSVQSRLQNLLTDTKSGQFFDSSSNGGSASGSSSSSDQPHKKKKKVTSKTVDSESDAMDVIVDTSTNTSTNTKPLFTIHAHAQKVSSINVIPENKQIMTASWDHLIKLYDMETQNSIHHFSTLKVITSMDHKSFFHLTLSSHTDGKIRLWDSRQKESVSGLETYGKDKDVNDCSWISQVKWQPVENSYLFASVDYDGCVKLWDMRSSSPLGMYVSIVFRLPSSID